MMCGGVARARSDGHQASVEARDLSELPHISNDEVEVAGWGQVS